MEKPEDPQFEPHAGIKMAQVAGSPMNIYGIYLFYMVWPIYKFASSGGDAEPP